MQDKQDKDICAHAPCGCTPREHSKYCSPYCEAAGDTLELACDCGHSGCGLEGAFIKDDLAAEPA